MPDKNWQFELEEYIKQGEPEKTAKISKCSKDKRLEISCLVYPRPRVRIPYSPPRTTVILGLRLFSFVMD